MLLCFSPAHAQGISAENHVLLDSLDAELARAPEYDRAKESALSRMKQRLSNSVDPEEQYWIYRDLFQGYSSYNSDSALYYSAKALAIANDLGRRHWAYEILMGRAYIMAATGMFEESRYTLSEIDPDQLTPRTFLNYWETALFIQTHLDQFSDVRNPILPYSVTTDQLLQSISNDLPVNDPDYFWLTGWRALRSPETAAEMIPPLERALAGSRFDTRTDARNAWMLSALCNKNSDQEKRLKYLILSAIADIRSSVREIASLEEIARLTYESGDLDHANSYISYCIHCANLYRNRVRIVGMADLQYEISQAYEAQNERQENRLSQYFVVLIVILVLLSGALAVIFVQLRRLRSRSRELDKANSDLSHHITELQEAREQLHAANESLQSLYSSVKEDAKEMARLNEVKEKYITDIFAICSEDISKLDEFRKRINRLIMAGRFDEVRQLTKNPELSHTELKELYANFDRIFLQIYPEFIEDFNKLLRPEERIVPKKGELLNTELRIYALVRLGLNDSVKISRFLHCSVQTVYNTRMKIRNKAVVPKEEFADRVRSLGKAVF